MRETMKRKVLFVPVVLLVVMPIAACSGASTAGPVQAPADNDASEALPIPTFTPIPPTPLPTITEAPPLPSPEPQQPEDEVGTVTGIVDGDSIAVNVGGQEHEVRYIGIDAPEFGRPNASEATEANRALVEGRTVTLVRDISEKDSHGRLLRYVYIGGPLVNGELVRQGWVRAVSYPPDVALDYELAALQAEAQAAGIGLWVPTPEPPTPVPGEAQVVIVAKDKQAEFVDIQNIGGAPQDLSGWYLLSERGDQDCPLGGVIQPGETLRIWAESKAAGQGGYCCGFDGPIWNNSEPDAAVLFNVDGVEVSRK
jgi:endonuclease YncB( thermonuclease family)